MTESYAGRRVTPGRVSLRSVHPCGSSALGLFRAACSAAESFNMSTTHRWHLTTTNHSALTLTSNRIIHLARFWIWLESSIPHCSTPSQKLTTKFATILVLEKRVYWQLLAQQLHADNCTRWPLLAQTITRKEIDRTSIARASMNSKNDHQGFIIICSMCTLWMSVLEVELFL